MAVVARSGETHTQPVEPGDDCCGFVAHLPGPSDEAGDTNHEVSLGGATTAVRHRTVEMKGYVKRLSGRERSPF